VGTRKTKEVPDDDLPYFGVDPEEVVALRNLAKAIGVYIDPDAEVTPDIVEYYEAVLAIQKKRKRKN
jgi:hypothetical protein